METPTKKLSRKKDEQKRDERNVIREAIVERMKSDGISQNEVSRRTGIGQGNVNQFCRGRCDCVTRVASRIMEALGMTLK